MSLECKHGQLARKCYICELEAELAEARRDVAELLTLSDIAVKVENRAALVAEVRKRYGLDAIDTARKETL